jgi:hypothetical protein
VAAQDSAMVVELVVSYEHARHIQLYTQTSLSKKVDKQKKHDAILILEFPNSSNL